MPFEMDYVDNDRPMLHRAAEDFWRRTVYPAGPLAARVIADEKLTPASFVEAYVRSRRHPRIRIEPAALALDDAIARIGGIIANDADAARARGLFTAEGSKTFMASTTSA